MTTVFLFILDYIPGFEHALNSSLQMFREEHITMNQCDSIASDFIWREITNNIKRLSYNFESQTYRDTKSELKKSNLISHMLESDLQDIDKNSLSYHEERQLYISKKNFPAHTSCLVAIFETMSNITAQTCGGVLVKSNWVLTAASCVDVLSYLNNNQTNLKSQYTIIANSSNPLSDGSVHNVTKIILHPKYVGNEPTWPHIALMEITAGLEVEPLEFIMSNNILGFEVDVYGWSVYKNGSYTDKMAVASFTAETLNPYKCYSNITHLKNNTLVCLRPNNILPNSLPINSGGPVLVLRGKQMYLLGLALIDDHNSFAIPLSTYVNWINFVTRG